MRTPLATLLLLPVLALGTTPAHSAPPSDPRALFAGPSSGSGSLRLGIGRVRPFEVQSQGRTLADGTFRLDQTVTFAGDAPRARHWIIRSTGPRRFAFTLSDAAGPGVASVEQGRFVLRYPLGNGLSMLQVLEPSADGRTIDNRGTIRWLGIPVGRLTETIERRKPTL